MPIYRYKAVNRTNKKVSGLVEADNEDAAGEVLREKGLSVITLAEKPKIDILNLISLRGIKHKDLVIFSRQFAVLVSANVALVHSLKVLSEQTSNGRFKVMIAEIADEVDAGSRLSDSLSKRPEVFSNFFVNVVKSGETSGKLDEVLNYLADELEKDYDMMSKIKGAMIYPAFVFLGLGGVGIMTITFVVPKLTGILQETGAELPMSTRILIATSDFFSVYWWLILIILVGIIFGLRIVSKTDFGKKIIDNVILHMPVFGKLFKNIFLVRFTRSLQTLIIGGVDISKGLKISAEVVNNSVYGELIRKTKKEVEDGNSISTVFVSSKYFPNMVSQMMIIGEKTGRLDYILTKITDFYTREINNTVANLLSLIEPIVLVVMGVAVGMMVAAVIMPMYNMASAL